MYDLKPTAPAEYFAGNSSRFRPTFPASRSVNTVAAGEDLGQACGRSLRVPHQCRAWHGIAVDAHRLSADDRSQRQHLPSIRGAVVAKLKEAERTRSASVRQSAEPHRSGKSRIPRSRVQSVPRRTGESGRSELPGPRPPFTRPCRCQPARTSAAIARTSRQPEARSRCQRGYRRSRSVLP